MKILNIENKEQVQKYYPSIVTNKTKLRIVTEGMLFKNF